MSRRDDLALRDLLLQVRRYVPIRVVEAWTDPEYFDVEEWAAAMQLKEGDRDVVVPAEPVFVRRFA